MADIAVLVGKWSTGKPEFVEYVEPTDTRGAQVVIDLTVCEGPNAGLRARWWGALRGGARPITEKQLTAMGWTGSNIKRAAGVGSKNVRFLVENQTWNGVTRAKVVAITAAKNFDNTDGDQAPPEDLPF